LPVEIKDVNNVPKLIADIDDILFRVSKKVGEYYESKLIDMLSEGWPGWAPLAPGTVKSKGSSSPWIDTGELWNQITYRVATGNLSSKVEIGIFEHEKAFIAQCLEFGTSSTGSVTAGGMMHQWSKGHIPERPLFRLVFDLEVEKVQSMIERELDLEIRRLFV